MSYESQNANYRDVTKRGRYEMAISEQAHLTFADDADPANAALADRVIKGDMAAIDSVIRALVVGPNGAVLDTDADLLAAVQGAWPSTASAWADQAV